MGVAFVGLIIAIAVSPNVTGGSLGGSLGVFACGGAATFVPVIWPIRKSAAGFSVAALDAGTPDPIAG
jgi:hypothetical protein